LGKECRRQKKPPPAIEKKKGGREEAGFVGGGTIETHGDLLGTWKSVSSRFLQKDGIALPRLSKKKLIIRNSKEGRITKREKVDRQKNRPE